MGEEGKCDRVGVRGGENFVGTDEEGNAGVRPVEPAAQHSLVAGPY
jgi:hypothetical protein